LTPALDTVVEWSTNDRRPSTSYFPPSKRPSLAIRRQSLLPATQQHLISGLLDASLFSSGDQGSGFTPLVPHDMVTRRVWVKRPGGSATLVPCRDDAVVDELRDQVIMKYGNSLGRSFDSPDIAIRVSPREGTNRPGHTERLLSPEEALSSILDAYYPGGQKIEEALVIDAPSRRTPKPSPRHSIYQHHHSEPGEHGDYFPLMPPVNANAGTPSVHSGSASAAATAPSISILNTGVAPLLPSPGSRRARHQQRPPLTRHKTNSPTILHNQNTQTPGITGTFSVKFALFHVATDIHRNRRFSSFPTYPAPHSSRSAYIPAGSTTGRISAGEITHSPGNCITTRGPKIKSSHFAWCYVWRVD
jgi:osomolarity two-component system response regulator SSK1